MSVPALVPPSLALRDPWLAAHAEWGPGLHEDGFGLTAADDVRTPEGFEAWVAGLHARSDRATFRWIVEQGEVQGGIALRHRGDERAGHIGYGLRPSARGRGLASWALGQVLHLARDLGLHAVDLVCEAENRASAAVIERNGGRVVEERTASGRQVLRYRIELAARPGTE